MREVSPMERFHVRVSGKRRLGAGPVPFDGRSRYYYCPACGRRTLISRRSLDIFNPPPSPFPPEVKARFGGKPASTEALDFYCGGCRRPVRLLFWSQERGMGGWWYGVVNTILELL
jgi:DNA-directed RNA polymerase subunit RPC12/RpoP